MSKAAREERAVCVANRMPHAPMNLVTVRRLAGSAAVADESHSNISERSWLFGQALV